MNMDACLPGHVAAEATAATKVETRGRKGWGEGGRETRERERAADDSKERGGSESRMKNAITILKNGPGLPREGTSTFGPVSA